MLDQIEQKMLEFNIQQVETLCFDIEKEKLPYVAVDYIFMSQVLLHIDDTELVLSRLYELLKTEGHLLIVDFDKNEHVMSDKVHNGFEQQQLAELMRKIGFKKIQAKTFYNAEKHHGSGCIFVCIGC